MRNGALEFLNCPNSGPFHVQPLATLRPIARRLSGWRASTAPQSFPAAIRHHRPATDLLALLLAGASVSLGAASPTSRGLRIVLRGGGALATCTSPAAAPPFNLGTSHCPSCSTPIRVRRYIRVVGWLLLRGRSPLVERRFRRATRWWNSRASQLRSPPPPLGVSTALALLHGVFLLALLTAALIDCDTRLLPDEITLPLLWLGLGCAWAFPERPALADAAIGAATGYLVLWGIYHAFRLLTGKEGMGHGDFKMLAALGAWFGWQALPAIVLIASLTGLAFALARRLRHGPPPTGDPMATAMPFGPFLAIGGCVTLFLHDWIVHATLFRGALLAP